MRGPCVSVELKKKFKYRLILNESQSIGVLGRRGAGLTDLYNIDVGFYFFLIYKKFVTDSLLF
jgi:7-keto-8-aminopelargonate synthetase-like enzyme